MYICVCACVSVLVHIYTSTACLWKSEDNLSYLSSYSTLPETVPSFSAVYARLASPLSSAGGSPVPASGSRLSVFTRDLRIQTQILMLAWEALHPLSHACSSDAFI